MGDGQLYKVLVDGKSCHGGDLAWSLPEGDKPGEWHDVTGDLVVCRVGLHLTDDPARWWRPGCTVYLAEARGKALGSCDTSEDRKVCVRGARLLRAATPDELAALRIYTSGVHTVTDGRAVASGSASVEAYGSASVVASGSASVRAYDSASVRAYDDVTVISWRGKPGARMVDRVVWIDRSGSVPVVYTAGNGGDDGAK